MNGSSTWPSQLLSNLSHTSAVGPFESGHTLTPDTHVSVPGLHSPMQPATTPPGQLAAHGVPTSVGESSTLKLQLLSTPSQTSAGKTQVVLSQSLLPLVLVVEAVAQWYSQPMVSRLDGDAGSWRKVSVPLLMQWATPQKPTPVIGSFLQAGTAPGRVHTDAHAPQLARSLSYSGLPVAS